MESLTGDNYRSEDDKSPLCNLAGDARQIFDHESQAHGTTPTFVEFGNMDMSLNIEMMCAYGDACGTPELFWSCGAESDDESVRPEETASEKYRRYQRDVIFRRLGDAVAVMMTLPTMESVSSDDLKTWQQQK